MLEIDGLCKSYGGRQILEPVRFFLPEGQCIGLVGENGSGKSTLLRLLAQIEAPDSGDIRYRGKSILGDRRFFRSRVGYVPQYNDLLQDLTVDAQLKLWQSACGLKKPLSRELEELLGIAPMRQKRIRNLSGGMQRRVAIGRALAARSEFLLMDEPFTGLDEGTKERVVQTILKYRNGRTLLVVTHQEEDIQLLGAEVIYLERK